MALKSEVFKQTIKKSGFWNYKELYVFCFDWFKDNGYDLAETEYVEKNSDAGKEIKLAWSASKKVTDYFKNTISVGWHILSLNSAEIERAGKKEKTNKGDLKIVIKAELEKDYEDNWEKKWFPKFMRGVYDKYVMRTTNDEYEDRLNDNASAFVDQIKAFLEL